MKIKLKLACLITLSVLTVPILSCSSLPEVKSQAFAPLKDEQTFETDFPTTWKAIEASLRQIRVISTDPFSLNREPSTSTMKSMASLIKPIYKIDSGIKL